MVERKTTPEMREQIAWMREAGATIAVIAATQGLSMSAVAHWLLVDAIDPPQVPPPRRRRSLPALRAGRFVHPFTEADDLLIDQLARDGCGYRWIARHLTSLDPTRPRKGSAILYRLAAVARQELRAEIAS